jgi:hypothetical protein
VAQIRTALMTAIRFAFVAFVTVPPSRGRFNRSEHEAPTDRCVYSRIL